MIKAIGAVFKGAFGDGASKTIENIASEWIQTDLEKAEASAVVVKALDPNGMMRRDLSRSIRSMYCIYLMVALSMLIIEFFCGAFGLDVKDMAATTEKIKSLFLPISGLFTTITLASFGVNSVNAHKGN